MDQTVYFPTLDQYKLSPAIAVRAVEGAPVLASVPGTVYSIEENAQTGTTVTMEIGSGYRAIYGQLTDLTVQEGDTVKEGEVIGYIGQPTKYYSKEGSNLYFAMKKDGEPEIRLPIFRKLFTKTELERIIKQVGIVKIRSRYLPACLLFLRENTNL